MNLRKSLLAGVVAVVGVVTLASSAQASVNGIGLSPANQSVASGTVVNYGWSWVGTGTYAAKLYYGDGGYQTYPPTTNGGSGSGSDTYFACSTTLYTPWVDVDSSQAVAQTLVQGNAGSC